MSYHHRCSTMPYVLAILLCLVLSSFLPFGLCFLIALFTYPLFVLAWRKGEAWVQAKRIISRYERGILPDISDAYYPVQEH